MFSLGINMQTVTLNLTQDKSFTLPGFYHWQQFQTLQSFFEDQGMRISYLDGVIELMTIGEQHELIKSMIALLLGIYFLKNEIEFIPAGSATRQSEIKSASFEPDESYYIGEKKEHPDLAIEVNLTSGSVKKLEKYKRFNIQEVWFWEDNKFSLYSLENNDYQQIFQSKLLPDLNFKLLEECVLIPSKLEAMKTFSSHQ